jgi:NitT/TauT family transport system permease protein
MRGEESLAADSRLKKGAAGEAAESGEPLLAAWRIWLPALAWTVLLLLHLYWPDQQLVTSGDNYTLLLLVLGGIYVLPAVASLFLPSWREMLAAQASLVTAAFVFLALAELFTLKLNVLPLPVFPSPVKVFEAFTNDGDLLLTSVLHSLRLLFTGYFLGAILGLASGILMGWYSSFRYWGNPVVRLIGPIPAVAWIPLVLAVFPTSFTASTFLIMLCTWFPVTVMTWSGMANVNKSYLEIAQTLGGDEAYLIFKVALPSAMPLIFIGMFMGMGASFATLIVAEMLGVKAGLGWYVQWAQGWGEYYKVYAALLGSAVLFSSLITLLFKARDRILVWQRGLLKW